jgi:hypothetical protein
MNDAKSSSLTSILAESAKLSQSDEDKSKKEEDDKKERRVIKMVILNGVFNFLLRAPDMLFWMENVNTWSIVFTSFQFFSSTGQYMPGFFSFIADIGYFTYILTFTTNFFIFYTFNKNFKEAYVFFWTSKTKLNTNATTSVLGRSPLGIWLREIIMRKNDNFFLI